MTVLEADMLPICFTYSSLISFNSLPPLLHHMTHTHSLIDKDSHLSQKGDENNAYKRKDDDHFHKEQEE